MPVHRAQAGRHRIEPGPRPEAARHRYAPPARHRFEAPASHNEQPPSRLATRYLTLLGTVITVGMIALAQAPAVEQARAFASAGATASLGPELANIRALARLGRHDTPVKTLEQRTLEAARRALHIVQHDPRGVGRSLAAKEYGWTGQQWTCLDRLWTRESNWRYRATNRTSGAYGIPQALPAAKMRVIASDWRDNPVTQIRWGLAYIDRNYGSPCAAWSHETNYGWY